MEGLRLGHTLRNTDGMNPVVPIINSSLVSRPSFLIQPKCILALSAGNFFFPSGFDIIIEITWENIGNEKVGKLSFFMTWDGKD